MRIRKIIGFMTACIISMLIAVLCVHADDISRAYDISGRIPDIELNRLDEILGGISEKTGFNTAVVITDDLGGKNAADYAEDFFNENYSAYPDSIILLINYDTNNDILYPTGRAKKYYTEDIRKKVLSEHIEPHIGKGNISDAVTAFAENSEEIFSSEIIEEDESSAESEADEPENYRLFLFIFAAISGIIVGIIVGMYIRSQYKYSCGEFAVSNYQCRKDIKFEVKEDKFRREYINKGNSENDA